MLERLYRGTQTGAFVSHAFKRCSMLSRAVFSNNTEVLSKLPLCPSSLLKQPLHADPLPIFPGPHVALESSFALYPEIHPDARSMMENKTSSVLSGAGAACGAGGTQETPSSLDETLCCYSGASGGGSGSTEDIPVSQSVVICLEKQLLDPESVAMAHSEILTVKELLKKKVEKLQTELHDVQLSWAAKVEKLQTELREARKVKSPPKTSPSSPSSQKLLQQARAQVQRLTKSLDMSKKAVAAAQTAHMETEDMMRMQVSRMVDALSKEQSTAAVYKASVEAMLENAHVAVEDANHTLDEYKGYNSQLKRRLDECKNNNKELTKNNKRLQREMKEMERSIIDANAILPQLQETKLSVKRLQNQVVTLTTSGVEARKSYVEESTQRGRLAVAHALANSKIRELEGKIERLVAEAREVAEEADDEVLPIFESWVKQFNDFHLYSMRMRSRAHTLEVVLTQMAKQRKLLTDMLAYVSTKYAHIPRAVLLSNYLAEADINLMTKYELSEHVASSVVADNMKPLVLPEPMPDPPGAPKDYAIVCSWFNIEPVVPGIAPPVIMLEMLKLATCCAPKSTSEGSSEGLNGNDLLPEGFVLEPGTSDMIKKTLAEACDMERKRCRISKK